MAVYSVYRETAQGSGTPGTVIVETYTETSAAPVSVELARLKGVDGFTYFATFVSGTPVTTTPANPGGIGGAGLTTAAPVPFVQRPSAGGATFPRWRGMNLPQKLAQAAATAYAQADFVSLANWGFNFARLTLDYRCWSAGLSFSSYATVAQYAAAVAANSTLAQQLTDIDNAISWGQANGIHIMLSLVRSPGYTVSHPPASTSMFNDTPTNLAESRRQVALVWGLLSQRYASIPASALTFEVINEPPDVTGSVYYQAIVSSVDAIRKYNPSRPIASNGLGFGTRVVPEVLPLGLIHTTHGTYYPYQMSAGSGYSTPTWPYVISGAPPVQDWGLIDNGQGYVDQGSYYKFAIQPLVGCGFGAMASEFGQVGSVPHAVYMAWIQDALTLFQQYDMGWCLWNMRYVDGWSLLDNTLRTDTTFGSYTDSAGTQHTIDNQLLALLQSY